MLTLMTIKSWNNFFAELKITFEQKLFKKKCHDFEKIGKPSYSIIINYFIPNIVLKYFHKIPILQLHSAFSIDILDNVSNELSSMNISHWADRKYKEGTKYLLSCVKLNGCAKYLSAAKDFNTFLAVDDKGKIYVMEIVSSNK